MHESPLRRRDAGAIELGWLTRVVLVLAVVGVGGVDGISVASTHLALQDDAAQAAVAGRDSYHDGHNVLGAYLAALQQADQVHPGSRIAAKAFVVNADGTVTVTVTRTPTTLVAHYLPWLRGHLEQTATAHSLPAT
jgi:hypothetical protein